MLNSISYLEICCTYNHMNLMEFVGATTSTSARRIFNFRARRYCICFDNNRNDFCITTYHGIPIAYIQDNVFKFYYSRAPEIGLNFVWGLLATLNLYPVKSF